MLKNIIFFILLATSFKVFSNDYIINKILYKKIILSYNQEVLINVFLNPMKIKDVIVYFNDMEIYDIKKNFNPVNNDNYFLPSFSFFTSNLQDISLLRIFIVLSEGMVLNSEATLFFKKGTIVDDKYFTVSKNIIFFIKAGIYSDNEEYNIEIENQNIIGFLEETIDQNILYYKLKSINYGIANINIYIKDDFDDKKLIKTVNINVVD